MARTPPKVHASPERPGSGWKPSLRLQGTGESRTRLGERSRIPWPSVGAGAHCARPAPAGKAGRLRPHPKAAFPPRAGRGPPRLRTRPSHRPCVAGSRPHHVIAARTQDGGQRPGLATGSPLQPAPQPPLARRAACPPHRWPRGAASGGGERGFPGATARASHHPPDSQHFPNHQCPPAGAYSVLRDSLPWDWQLRQPMGTRGGRGGSIPGVRGRWAWRVEVMGRWAGPSGAVPATPPVGQWRLPGARGGRAEGGAEP